MEEGWIAWKAINKYIYRYDESVLVWWRCWVFDSVKYRSPLLQGEEVPKQVRWTDRRGWSWSDVTKAIRKEVVESKELKFLERPNEWRVVVYWWIVVELSETNLFDLCWWISTFGGRKKRLEALLVRRNAEDSHILINGRDLKLRSTVRTNTEIGAVQPVKTWENLRIDSLTDACCPLPDQWSDLEPEINGQNGCKNWSGTTNKKLRKTSHRYIDWCVSPRILARDSSLELTTG